MSPEPEWFEKDYYKILGVSATATQKEISTAYRKLARENHPDQNPGNSAAEDRFKEISAANDVLSDEGTRQEYDQVKAMGPMGGFRRSASPGNGPGGFTFESNRGDFGDILGGLFGRGRGGAQGRPAASGPQRGQDLQTDLHLPFEESVIGVTTQLNLTSEVSCSRCSGNGSEPGTRPKACPTCSGRGVIEEPQGFFSFSQPCPTCSGRGTIVENPCTQCRGRGVEHRPRQIKARIPAGVLDGQTIRLKGRGAPGTQWRIARRSIGHHPRRRSPEVWEEG